MADNSRIKMSDFPLCEDTDIIESLLGVGSDKGTYKVDINDLKPEEQEEPLHIWTRIPRFDTFYESGNIYLEFSTEESTRLMECLKTGGYLHISLTHESDIDIVIPIGNTFSAVGSSTAANWYTHKNISVFNGYSISSLIEISKKTGGSNIINSFIAIELYGNIDGTNVDVNGILFESVPEINQY